MVDCELHKSTFTSLSANVEMFLEWAPKGEIFHCQVTAKLSITDVNEPEEVLNASVTLRASYRLNNHLEVTDDDIEAFAKVSVTFSLHPYIRETLQNLTVRAGLPPFTLSSLKSPLDSETAEAVLRTARDRPTAKPRKKPAPKRVGSKQKKAH